MNTESYDPGSQPCNDLGVTDLLWVLKIFPMNVLSGVQFEFFAHVVNYLDGLKIGLLSRDEGSQNEPVAASLVCRILAELETFIP